jgi:hypothetical protein
VDRYRPAAAELGWRRLSRRLGCEVPLVVRGSLAPPELDRPAHVGEAAEVLDPGDRLVRPDLPLLVPVHRSKLSREPYVDPFVCRQSLLTVKKGYDDDRNEK